MFEKENRTWAPYGVIGDGAAASERQRRPSDLVLLQDIAAGVMVLRRFYPTLTWRGLVGRSQQIINHHFCGRDGLSNKDFLMDVSGRDTTLAMQRRIDNEHLIVTSAMFRLSLFAGQRDEVKSGQLQNLKEEGILDARTIGMCSLVGGIIRDSDSGALIVLSTRNVWKAIEKRGDAKILHQTATWPEIVEFLSVQMRTLEKKYKRPLIKKAEIGSTFGISLVRLRALIKNSRQMSGGTCGELKDAILQAERLTGLRVLDLTKNDLDGMIDHLAICIANNNGREIPRISQRVKFMTYFGINPVTLAGCSKRHKWSLTIQGLVDEAKARSGLEFSVSTKDYKECRTLDECILIMVQCLTRFNQRTGIDAAAILNDRFPEVFGVSAFFFTLLASERGWPSAARLGDMAKEEAGFKARLRVGRFETP